MRHLPILLVSAFCACLPVGAIAQPPMRRPGDQPPRPLTRADSLRTLSGPLQLWTHVGAGWMSAPSNVRERYKAGLDLGVSADRRFADRIALRGRLEYDDLPSTQPESILLNGVAFSVSADYGHGWFGSAMAGTAVRTWKHLWLEGAAGAGYFRNGFSSGETFQDLGTGQDIPLEASSGWGRAWTAGMRYEFQPSRRDRMLGEVQFASMERGGTPLRFFAVRFGYRAF